MKKIVFVAPHPDDVELFAGGAAIKHSADGFKTVEILLTKGELGAFLRKKNLADRRWGGSPRRGINPRN